MTIAGEAGGGGIVVAFFDLDGVLIRGTSGVALCAGLVRRGRSPIAALIHAALAAGLYTLGNRSLFATHGVAGRLLSGRSVDEVATVASELAASLEMHGTVPFVRDRLQAHVLAGHVVVMASAAPHPIAEAVAARLGIVHVLSTRYAVSAGRYTGAVDGRVALGEHKATCALEFAARVGSRMDEAYAYCDDFADRWLLDRVGHPVVVRPERSLRSLARTRGWLELTASPPGSLVGRASLHGLRSDGHNVE